MFIEDENSLKVWISKEVEPLSDADPDPLAKYVLALIKKQLTIEELENLCTDKLNVFLQNNTESFVQKLFEAITNGSYLNRTESQDERPKEAVTTRNDIDLIVTDGEELVLNYESDHDIVPKTDGKKFTEQLKHTEAQIKEKDLHKPKEKDSVQRSSSGSRIPENIVQSSQTKPTRKRISPPPSDRDRFAERRRASPIQRRRVFITGGGNNSTAGRIGNFGRYRRRGSRSPLLPRPKSRSRSPHRKKDEHDDRPIRRQRCRDFHEKGYCMRGDKCHYDHGPDPVVVDDSALEKMMVRSSTALSTTSSVYDVYNNALSNPPPPGLENKLIATGAAPEGYNPEAPALTSVGGSNPIVASSLTVPTMDFSVPPPPIPTGFAHQHGTQIPAIVYNAGMLPPYNHPQPGSVSTSGIVTVGGTTLAGGISQGGTVGSGAGPIMSQTLTQNRTRGGPRFRPYGGRMGTGLSCSLIVKKIPPEQNKIATLDQHFGKFGQITNIQVQYEGRTDVALITYKTRREAQTAYKSIEPILNNRFIKVFWQNESTQDNTGEPTTKEDTSKIDQQRSQPIVPLPPRGAFSKTYTASAEAIHDSYIPLSNNTEIQQHVPSIKKSAAIAKKLADKEALMKLLELHKAKSDFYAKLVDEQRDLLKRAQEAQSNSIKKRYIELAKKLDESTKEAKIELQELKVRIDGYSQKQSKAPKTLVRSSSVKAEMDSDQQENSQDCVTPQKKQNSASNTPSKKLFKVVYVFGCPPTFTEQLISHMEKYGDLFDIDITPQHQQQRQATFTYKDPANAQIAVAEAAKTFEHASIKVEWAPVSSSISKNIVPDGERNPEEQFTPAALLASIDDSEEDEEDDENENESDNTRQSARFKDDDDSDGGVFHE